MPITEAEKVPDPTRIAVGVIYVGGLFCVSRRPEHLHQGGLWEFPGGKIQAGEDIAEALARELREELGIEITAARHFLTVPWDYPEKQVVLEVCWVEEIEGQPRGLEGQQVRWVQLEELPGLAFPEPNTLILEQIRQQLAEH